VVFGITTFRWPDRGTVARHNWGVIRTAPRIKLRKEYGRSTLIDPETETKLLAVARQPLRDVLLIMLATGLRPSEVFRMRWEDIDWERGTIFIPFGKTRNSRRYLPMSQRVTELLSERRRTQHEGWVFPSDSEVGHLTTVAKAFADARTAAGVRPSVVLYSARHTFATSIMSSTGNLAIVMRALGHANAQTAMIYQHPSMETVRVAVDQKNQVADQRHNLRHSPIM
jgi:integrase